MESLYDKTRRYRDETLRELEALERRAEALKNLIRTLDDLLETQDLSKSGLPRAARKGPPSEFEKVLIAACCTWKTVHELVTTVPRLQSLSKSNLSTRCRRLWLRGHLERRNYGRLKDHPNLLKEFEYKSLNPVKVCKP